MGLSLVKAARKTGRISARMAESVTRYAAFGGRWTSACERLSSARRSPIPPLTARAVREAVKIEKADDLFRLTRNVGEVQAKAGTRAALDGLKISDYPRQMARVAKLAEKQGGKTRAILKFLGRGAIALTVAAFDLSLWVLWAALTIFGFVSAAKGAVERATWRGLQQRKVRRAKRELQRQRRLAMAPAQGRVRPLLERRPTCQRHAKLSTESATSRSPISTRAEGRRADRAHSRLRVQPRGQLGLSWLGLDAEPAPDVG